MQENFCPFAILYYNSHYFGESMKILLLILLLTAPVAAQKTIESLNRQIKSFKSAKDCRAEYDKFADKTNVRCSINKDLLFDTIVSFQFDGQTLNDTVNDFYLSFSFRSRNWHFLNDRDLIILADSERISFGTGERTSRTGTTRRSVYVIETLHFKTDRAMLERLSKAKKMEFRLGKFDYAMSDKAQDLFRNIMDLGAVK